jgi:hypothetical protein
VFTLCDILANRRTTELDVFNDTRYRYVRVANYFTSKHDKKKKLSMVVQ